MATDPTGLSRLGLVDLDNAFATTGYYDYRPNSGEVPFKRYGLSFESAIIKSNAIDRPPFSIVGWVIRGAIREDDDVSKTDESPKEDTRGDIHRVFSHFQDPANNNRALTIPALGQLGASASDWALTAGASTPSFIFDGSPQRYNNFNLVSFRESEWIALTGLDKMGTNVAPAASIRNVYWATAFRSLGDIMHLNQDMAQPQHTRNDAHAGRFNGIFAGHKSVFERYVDARVRGDLAFSNTDDYPANPNILINPQSVNFGNYPIPSFAQYSDYWAGPAKTGLADYSNTGFFSIGTLPSNLSNVYASPSRSDGAFSTQQVTITRWNGASVAGWVPKATLYIGGVPDATGLQPAATNVPLYAKSIWEESRQTLTLPLFGPLQTLVKANYDAAIDLLVPRAVAYSAGLLQYAFRGRLQVTPPDEGVYSLVDHFDFSGTGQPATAPTTGFKGFKTIKLKLRNATPDITPSGGGTAAPQIMTGGTLVAVIKFYRNTKHTDDLANELANTADYLANRSTAEEIVVSSRVKDANGNLLGAVIPVTTTAQTFVFEFDQELPINATDVKLQVVYRGVLGSEADAVVVETVDISEPTFLAYLNSSDYIQLGNGFYTRDQINAATSAGAALRSQIQPPSCIDGMTNQLANGCFQPFGVNFAMKFGTAINTAVAGFTVPANKNFNRLGTLIPAGTNVVMNLPANSSPCGAAATKASPGATVQTDYELQGDGTYIPLITTSQVKYNVRGIRTHFVVVCAHNGDGVPHTADLTQTQVMQLAIPADAKPLKLSSFNYGAP